MKTVKSLSMSHIRKRADTKFYRDLAIMTGVSEDAVKKIYIGMIRKVSLGLKINRRALLPNFLTITIRKIDEASTARNGTKGKLFSGKEGFEPFAAGAVRLCKKIRKWIRVNVSIEGL